MRYIDSAILNGVLAGAACALISWGLHLGAVWPGAITTAVLMFAFTRIRTRVSRIATERRARILEALAGGQKLSGLELWKVTGLGPGSLYPHLDRLADEGWLTSEWETGVPEGQPRRRFYSLSNARVR